VKSKLLTATLLVLAHGALAQQPPGGGGQLQQIPPSPAREREAPEFKFDRGTTPAPTTADGVKVVVNSLRITGQTAYSETELVAVAEFKPGNDVSLTELRAMALRIAAHYHRNGYFLAQAYLPAQEIRDGDVTITVMEGRYGNITLRNKSTLSDGLANSLLRGLNTGDTVTIGPLEERLLLLSDVAGVNVKSTLIPGASVGTADLIVDVIPGQRVTGSIEADNAGNRYTGEYRVGGTVQINNLTGHGDVATLRVLTSGSGLVYGRASYQMQFGRATAGVAYSYMDYRLGKEFSSLGAHGTAQIVSVFGGYPLIRSRNTNLYAVLNLDFKSFEDKLDLTGAVTEKETRVLNAGVHGNHRDGILGGGYSGYSATGSFGEIDIQTPAALAIDAATARSNGNFSKLGLQVMRLQNLGGPFSLYGAIRGQFASKNLDISEKMELGGMYAVRAYPEGEAYADEGYVATLEARMLLPKFSDQLPGRMHLIGFVDTGSVTLNKNPWAAGDNSRTLSGAGIGFTWLDYNNFSVRTYWAHKLGNAAATSAPDASSRFWIQLVKYF